MSLYENFTELYKYIFTDSADPRTNNWYLISSPVPGLTILAAYLYFVTSWGPRYMANRKPYKLDNILIVYNLIQVVLSTYMFYGNAVHEWFSHYSWTCQPVNTSTGAEGMREARACYIYLLAKLSELLDTVSSFNDASSIMDCHEIFHRKKYNFRLFSQFICSYCDVLVLFTIGIGPTNAEISVVEKIHHKHAIELPNVILMYFMFSSFYKRSYNPANGAKSEQSKQNIPIEGNNNETWKAKEFNSKIPSFADNNLLLKEANDKAKII